MSAVSCPAPIEPAEAALRQPNPAYAIRPASHRHAGRPLPHSRRGRGMPRDSQHAHVARCDRVGRVAGRDALSDAGAVSVPRPQQVRRLRGRAPRRERTAAHARASAGMGHARVVGGPAHAGARRQARAFAHAPRRHAVSARQLGTHAGERRGDLRGHLRSDRERAPLRDRAVLHRARRRARRDAQRRADRESATRRARLFPVRQHRQLRSAASLCGGAARGRRGDASVRHQSPLRQPLCN